MRRLADAADQHERQPHGRAHGQRIVEEEERRKRVVRHEETAEEREPDLAHPARLHAHHVAHGQVAAQHVERRFGDKAAAQHEGVGALAFEAPRHLDGFGGAEPASEPVGEVQLDEQRHARAERGPHGAEHGEREAQAVFEGAAVVVGTAVRVRREELREQVAVTGVQLDGVEARRPRDGGAGGEVGDDPVHVGARHGAASGEPVEVEPPDGPNRPPLAQRLGREIAGVSDLQGRGGPLTVDGVAEPAQAGPPVGGEQQLVAVRATVGRHGGIGYRREAHAARRHGLVVRDERPGDDPALGHAFKGRRAHEAVAQLQRTERCLGEDRTRRNGPEFLGAFGHEPPPSQRVRCPAGVATAPGGRASRANRRGGPIRSTGRSPERAV